MQKLKAGQPGPGSSGGGGSKTITPVAPAPTLKESLSYFTDLPGFRDIAPKDSVMMVNVTHIKHPWNFYVTCKQGWGCCCKNMGSGDKHSECRVAKKMAAELTKELSNETRFTSLQLRTYVKLQLVAFILVKNGIKTVNRAVVQESSFDPNTPKGMVKIKLLDTGEKFLTEKDMVCSLPMNYATALPARAMACTLNGVSPFASRWDAEATEYFRKLVTGKKCILIIKRTPSRKFAPGEELDNSYEVELRVRRRTTFATHTHETGFRSVAEKLWEKNHGVLWSATPYRPQLSKILNIDMLSLFSVVNDDKKIWDEVHEREEVRKLQIIDKFAPSAPASDKEELNDDDDEDSDATLTTESPLKNEDKKKQIPKRVPKMREYQFGAFDRNSKWVLAEIWSDKGVDAAYEKFENELKNPQKP